MRTESRQSTTERSPTCHTFNRSVRRTQKQHCRHFAFVLTFTISY